MERDAPHRDRGRSLLLALIAAAVLAAGVAAVWSRGSVDQAAVLETPGAVPSGQEVGTAPEAPPGEDVATTSPEAEPPRPEPSAGPSAGTDEEPGTGADTPAAPGGGDIGAGDVGAGNVGAAGSAAAGQGDGGSGDTGRPPGGAGTTATGTPAAGDGTAASDSALPYGTPADERAAAQAPAELAQTGPAVPAVLAALVALTGLVVSGLGRAAGPRRRRTRAGA